MGLVHTPRVIGSIARGFLKRRSDPSPSIVGIGVGNDHKYVARVGLFDVDYLGHLNNAAYLNHAELARWEMTAYNGLLGTLAKNRGDFMVAGTSVRFRREVRPLFRKFQVDTTLAGLDDDNNIWATQNFRYPGDTNNRVRAQIVVRAVVVQNRQVLDPRLVLHGYAGIDKDLVDSLCLTKMSDEKLEELFERYAAMEESFRDVAAADDEKHAGI